MLPSYFKRDDIRGIYPDELNANTAAAIGYAVSKLLRKDVEVPSIAIGFDCRHGNYDLEAGFTRGAFLGGGECYTYRLMSTEQMYFICGTEKQYDATVMLTASHNPKEYSGMKIMRRGCIPFTKEEWDEIGKLILSCPENVASSSLAQIRSLNTDKYAALTLHLSGLDKQPDSTAPRLKIVVMAGYGMGGVSFEGIARKLEEKGVMTIFAESKPNGDFPNGVPNPLDKAYVARLAKHVVENNADLGICFDGDADRAGFVDSKGEEITPAQVFALIAKSRLSNCRRDKCPVIMRNICCSQLLYDLFGREKCVELVDTPVGHGRIKLLMRSEAYRDRCIFAGEHSGHYFYPEYFYVDSGVLTSLNMIKVAWTLREKGGSLAEELAPWRNNYRWSGEINFSLESNEQIIPVLKGVWESENTPDVSRYQVVEEAESGLQHVVEDNGTYQPENLPAPDLKMLKKNRNGGWWFVVRPSGNEPRLRLNVEAWGENAQNACALKTEQLVTLLKKLGAKN